MLRPAVTRLRDHAGEGRSPHLKRCDGVATKRKASNMFDWLKRWRKHDELRGLSAAERRAIWEERDRVERAFLDKLEKKLSDALPETKNPETKNDEPPPPVRSSRPPAASPTERERVEPPMERERMVRPQG